MNWHEASDWVAALDIGGVTGWRLPTTVDRCYEPTSFCNWQLVDPDSSEFAHLYYVTLGNIASPTTSIPYMPYNFGPFQFLFGYPFYWTATEAVLNSGDAWYFDMADGFEGASDKQQMVASVWAVHPGDVGTPVPEPSAVALMLLGGGLLCGWRNRANPVLPEERSRVDR